MKLVQLNIWQGRIISHVVLLLEQEQPDIMCLQEVYSSEQPVKTWDNFSSLEAIQTAFPGYHTFFAPLYSYSVMGQRVTFGNAILSRFPISDEQHAFTCGHYINDFAHDPYVPNTRNYQTCTLNLADGKKLSLVNHHGYWDAAALGTDITVEKMQIAKDAAAKLPRPIIFAGDLNVRAESKAMRVFDGFLEDLTGTYKIETTLTQLARAFDANNMVPCDHILVSPEVTVENFAVSDEIASDHKAVILEFSI